MLAGKELPFLTAAGTGLWFRSVVNRADDSVTLLLLSSTLTLPFPILSPIALGGMKEGLCEVLLLAGVKP